MLLDILYGILASILSVITLILKGINFAVPDQITDGITYMFSYLNYLNGIWPVADTMAALGSLISFFTIWYTGKLLFKAYALLPWVGKKAKLHGGA